MTMITTPPQRSCWKKKIICTLSIALLIMGTWIALPYIPWLQKWNPATQKFADMEDRLHGVEQRLDQITAHTEKMLSESPNEIPTPRKDALDVARMQNDLTALQAQVQQNGVIISHAQQTTQASLAEAIAYMQLRGAATSGQNFAIELQTMKNVAKNNPNLQDPMIKLEPFA
mgnify:CR=1 FL=1